MLWPYLFEFITDRNFTNALGVIIRSLSVLAQSKKEAAPVKSNETGDEVKTVEPIIDFHSVGKNYKNFQSTSSFPKLLNLILNFQKMCKQQFFSANK